ncbi:uncharacterized protein [Ptychodera flava]|uniref:uncharacterized protein n=1 Tax=Ptychodera flava TaxID=63121 RepID=UPI00396AAA3E
MANNTSTNRTHTSAGDDNTTSVTPTKHQSTTSASSTGSSTSRRASSTGFNTLPPVYHETTKRGHSLTTLARKVNTPPVKVITQPGYDPFEEESNVGLFSAGGGIGGFVVLLICFILLVKFAKRYCKQEDFDDPERCDHDEPLPQELLLQENCEPSPPSPPPTYSDLFSDASIEQNGSVPPSSEAQSQLLNVTLAEVEEVGEEEVCTPPPTYEYALARSMENLARSMEHLNNGNDDDVFTNSTTGGNESATTERENEITSSNSDREQTDTSQDASAVALNSRTVRSAGDDIEMEERHVCGATHSDSTEVTDDSKPSHPDPSSDSYSESKNDALPADTNGNMNIQHHLLLHQTEPDDEIDL